MKGLTILSQPIFPTSAKSLTIGTGAAAGFLYGSFPGMAIGGALGYAAGKVASDSISTVTEFVCNGTNTVYQGAKELVQAASTKFCGMMYNIAISLPLWLIDKVENTKWVQTANAFADTAYLSKCRSATYQIGSQEVSGDLQSLFTAVPEGVSSQAQVIAALSAYAIATGQGVSKGQISQWIALGERLIAELTNDKASQVHDGAIVVQSPQDGKEIYVESSVYNTRAIMWYFAAQALWGELVKQEVLLCGHAQPTAADIQRMVKDLLTHETFVFPDKNGQVFTFLSQAKTSYVSETNLLGQDSALQRADQAVRNQTPSMALPVIDDTSRYLPGGARRTAFNTLLPVEENKEQRLAVRLEELSYPSVLGQRSEGHEPLLWQVAQMAIGVPRQIVAMAEKWKAPSSIAPQTRPQQQQHAIHTKMLEMLRRVRSGDAAWKVNQRAAFDAAKQLPLHELLPYLVHPEYAQTNNVKLAVLNEISDIERDQLKVMVYRALLDEVHAGKNAPLHRRGHETFLMPYMTGKTEVRDYWRTHIASLQETIFGATFTAFTEKAKREEESQYRVSRWIRSVTTGTPTAIIQKRKEHEQALFQQAYLANLEMHISKDAQTVDTLTEFDMEA